MSSRIAGWALLGLLWAAAAAAESPPQHALWELHGRHNTVYLLGSIHVLRASDYPLAPAVEDAYRNSQSLLMEVNLDEMDSQQMQTEMLTSAMLPEGRNLEAVLGAQRYARASGLARTVGVELSMFGQFAPWFVAEAVSQLQLAQLGFEAQSGVEMHFLELARGDGKSITGLESVHDQIALFLDMSMDAQAKYLLSSLEQAHDLPAQVADMVRAWKRGDTAWFETQMAAELGSDPALYDTLIVARNRKWVPKIEALLNADRNYLVIVGTGHLIGRSSVLELLDKDGIAATQR